MTELPVTKVPDELWVTYCPVCGDETSNYLRVLITGTTETDDGLMVLYRPVFECLDCQSQHHLSDWGDA